jgi:Fe-S oxidoreductase
MSLEKLSNLRTDMEKCFRCSLCKMVPLPVALSPKFTDACPASRLYHFHGFSGSGKQIMALSLLDRRIEPDRALADIVFACTTCGYCDVACKFIMDAERHRINMALREFLVEKGLAPQPVKDSMNNLEKFGNAGGETANSPGAWAAGLDLKILPDQKADVLLVAGCAQRGDKALAKTARKLAIILKRAGADVGILGDSEPCCGLPAYWTGHRELFEKIASRNAAMLDKLGVSAVVTASGSCLGSIRSKYGEYAKAPDARVIHATEYLDTLIGEGVLKLTREVRKKVTYHDPCYLGRQSEPYTEFKGEEKIALGVMTYTDPPKKISYGIQGVYEEPRRIIQAVPGIQFTEMHRIREYSFCCGAGGGAPLTNPDLAGSAALHRFEEAREVGAETLVTACAHCETHFMKVREETGEKESMPVMDIIDLVFEAAGLEDGS